MESTNAINSQNVPGTEDVYNQIEGQDSGMHFGAPGISILYGMA